MRNRKSVVQNGNLSAPCGKRQQSGNHGNGEFCQIIHFQNVLQEDALSEAIRTSGLTLNKIQQVREVLKYLF